MRRRSFLCGLLSIALHRCQGLRGRQQHDDASAPRWLKQPMGNSTSLTTANPSSQQPTAAPFTTLAWSSDCGCLDSCTQSVWDAVVTDATSGLTTTCGDRMQALMMNPNNNNTLSPLPMIDACYQVAHVQVPTICGGCDPTRCDNNVTDTKPVGEGNVTLGGDFLSIQTASLYCFPEYATRVQYTNVWNEYTLQVKESSTATCGPGNNLFSSDTVQLATQNTTGSNDQLSLQFKQVNGAWTASEVRLVSTTPFLYGSYSFHVQSVSVYDDLGQQIASQLPPSLVLGLFTWDDTDDYSIHENWNHEVDVEISQWNKIDNEDAQFLVQPPDDHVKQRFWSGGSPNVLDQGNKTWSFQWLPGAIAWSTDDAAASSDMTYSISTQSAVEQGFPDYVQCLPTNALELRMNLWNVLDTDMPTGMADGHMVEVVIDDFVYEPSDLTGVPDQGYCTKDCQCETGSVCTTQRCTAALPLTVPQASSPGTDIFASAAEAMCLAHAGCAGLKGDCCPNASGHYLQCCTVHATAACSNHARCAGLQGACCPTQSGAMLDCCA